jgi:hypothetical protein
VRLDRSRSEEIGRTALVSCYFKSWAQIRNPRARVFAELVLAADLIMISQV